MSVTKKVQKNIKANQKSNDLLDALDNISSEDKKWLNERPTRMEIINYVNSLWEHHHLPTITNYIQISSMVIQAILIDKGICTGDEIKDITEKFIAEQQRRMSPTDESSNTESSTDEVEKEDEKSKKQGE